MKHFAQKKYQNVHFAKSKQSSWHNPAIFLRTTNTFLSQKFFIAGV